MTTAIISPTPKLAFWDANGDPLSGGKLYTYAAGTTTLQTTYTDSTATTPNTNPVILDSRGEASVWLGAAPYKYRLTTSTDALIFTVDNITGSSSASVGTTSVFTNVAAVIAATIPSSTLQLIVSGYTNPGDAGVLMTYAKTVTASGPGIITSADGAHWILTNNPTNWVMFGADKTGVSSSVTAINSWVSWANALTGTAGVSSVQPDGIYLIDSSINAITGNGVWIQGNSIDGLVLKITATGAATTWSGTFGGMRSLTLYYPSTPNSAAICALLSSSADTAFLDISIKNANTFVQLGVDGSHVCAYVTFRNILGYVYNSGKPTFDARYGVGLNISAVSMYVNGVGVPAQDRVSTMTTVSGTNFLDMTHGSWDTVIIDGNTQTNRYWTALNFNAPGAIINNVTVDKTCIFDYNSSDAIVMAAPTNASGGLVNFNIHAEYIFSWSGYGIVLTGDNDNEIHSFEGAKVTNAGKDGFNFSGAATAHFNLNNTSSITVNRLDGGYVGVRIAAAISHWTMTGAQHIYYIPGLSSAWGGDYAVKVGADCNNFAITDGDYAGNLGAFSLADNTSRSAWRWIARNAGGDYSGAKTTGMFVVPATTVAWNNDSAFQVQVNYYGLDNIVVNGQTAAVSGAATVGGSIIMMPGETFTPYYGGSGHVAFWVSV